MFNSKPLWWTCLIVWISLSVYWHTCKLMHLCEAFPNTGFFGESTDPQTVVFTNKIYYIFGYNVDADRLFQYLIMFGITIALGFLTGNSYGSSRKSELRYKLNRITREVQFYSKMQ
jgi:predicted permease